MKESSRESVSGAGMLRRCGWGVVAVVVIGWSASVVGAPSTEESDRTKEVSDSGDSVEAPDGASVAEKRGGQTGSGDTGGSGTSGAEDDSSSRVGVSDGFLFRPEFRTDVPLLIGGGLQFEFPGRIRGSVSVGSLPLGYIRAGNWVSTGMFEEYNDNQATLVEDSVQSSLVWRFHGGMRPMKDLGLYIDGGYTLATLGGRSTSGETIDELVEADIPMSVQESFDVDATSTLHMLDLEVGWEFFRETLWNVRAGIGWSFTVAAEASLESRYEGQGEQEQAAIDALERQGEDHLVESYKKYVHPPYLTLSVGFGF